MKTDDLVDPKFPCFCSPSCVPTYHVTAVVCDNGRQCTLTLQVRRRRHLRGDEPLKVFKHSRMELIFELPELGELLIDRHLLCLD